MKLVWLTIMAVLLIVAGYGCDRSTDSDAGVVITLIDEQLDDGRCIIMWPQTNQQGNQVPAGSYIVRMIIGGYKWSDEFDILAGAEHVPSPCESSYCDPDVSPYAFNIFVNADTYAVCDTVCITYDLPVTAAVVIQVER